MTEAGYALGSPRLAAPARPRERRRLATSALIWAFVAGNAAVMVWLWVNGGNLSDDLSTLTSRSSSPTSRNDRSTSAGRRR